MAKSDYVPITAALPPEGTRPKVLIGDQRRGRIAYPSADWTSKANKWGGLMKWKAHWTEGGPKGG